MPRPTCVQCEVGFKVEKSGVHLVEMHRRPQVPYQVWPVELLECPMCGVQIIGKYPDEPVMRHHEKGFDEWFELLKKSGVMIIYQFEG